MGGVPCLFLQGTAGNIGTGKWVAGTPREDLRAAVEEVVRRWRAEAAAPLLSRPTADAMGLVVRSVEAVLAGLDDDPDGGSVPVGAHPATDGRGQQGE